MDEPPAEALRGKKDSSMRVAINLVKNGDGARLRERRQHRRADGDLALRAEDAARHRPSGDRLGAAEHARRHTYVLDLGANVDCTAEHLLQFARHGRALVAAVEGKERPDGRPAQHRRRGHQGQRGGEAGRRAAARAAALNFYGNVEGDDIYKGTTDVVVCDGFVGNVALKTSEGLARCSTTTCARSSRATC